MTKAFTVFDPHHLQTVCHVILNVGFGYFMLHTCVFNLVICCRASSHTSGGTFISVTRSIFKVFLPVTFAQNPPTRMWMRLSLMFRAHAGVFAGRTESFKRAGFYIECEVELGVCNIGSVIKHDSGTFLFVRSSVWQNFCINYNISFVWTWLFIEWCICLFCHCLNCLKMFYLILRHLPRQTADGGLEDDASVYVLVSQRPSCHSGFDFY